MSETRTESLTPEERACAVTAEWVADLEPHILDNLEDRIAAALREAEAAAVARTVERCAQEACQAAWVYHGQWQWPKFEAAQEIAHALRALPAEEGEAK